MKATELMIGDWVIDTYTNKPMRISGVNSLMGDGLEPVPLTPEILEKNGFNWGHTPDSEDYASAIGCAINDPEHWYYDKGEGVIEVIMPNGDDGGAIQTYLDDLWVQFSFNQIIYVHQLQHALRLCGIEKEIEL